MHSKYVHTYFEYVHTYMYYKMIEKRELKIHIFPLVFQGIKINFFPKRDSYE